MGNVLSHAASRASGPCATTTSDTTGDGPSIVHNMTLNTNATEVGLTADLSHEAEMKRVKAEIDALVKEIIYQDKPVNIVFSSPLCIGVAQYCEDFVDSITNKAFRFVDSASLNASRIPEEVKSQYKARLENIETKRTEAIDSFTASEHGQRRTILLHTADLQKELCLHQFLVAIERHEESLGPTPSNQDVERARLRVYHQNQGDHVFAMAKASLDLKYIHKDDFDSLEIQSEAVWTEASKVRKPSDTLYVYIHYPDDVYAQTYEAWANQIKNTMDSRRPYRRVIALEQHSKLTKKYMEELYSNKDNDIVKNCFSMMMIFDSNTLGSRIHMLVLCRELLTTVRLLQKSGIWGENDAKRINFLATSAWLVHRRRLIPRDLSYQPVPSRSQIERNFGQGSPPIPRSRSKKLQSNLTSTEPILVSTSSPSLSSSPSTSPSSSISKKSKLKPVNMKQSE